MIKIDTLAKLIAEFQTINKSSVDLAIHIHEQLNCIEKTKNEVSRINRMKAEIWNNYEKDANALDSQLYQIQRLCRHPEVEKHTGYGMGGSVCNICGKEI